MENILTNEFINSYKNKQPNWGFNGLGYIVYKRTYSRLKENAQSEEWFETVARCIKGAQEIGANYTKEEAERLFDHIFNLRCNFAGRMLWQLGTDSVKKFGANSLLNCWFAQMNEPEKFAFLFENLMLGGGVGYSVRREDVHELPKIKEDVKITHLNTKDATFIVPDSREGWVGLLRKVLRSYFQTGKTFSYSTILIRGYGEPIKGFGGVASGPQILIDGIKNICNIMEARSGKKLRSIDVLDICNIIGSIVVSGNVRRSAQIALGDPDDFLYIRAKRWDLGNIPNWRSLSNNTIYADDFTHITNDIWEGYHGNGEPYGLYNVKLSSKIGRIGESRKDNCQGTNPCFTGDTLIDTLYGQIEIKEIAEKFLQLPVYCYDGEKINISFMKNIRKTGIKQLIWKLILDNGKEIKATPNHLFMLRNGSYKELSQLKVGDSLMPFRRYKRNSKGYNQISLNNGKNIGEAQFVCEWKYGRKMRKDEHTHHKDLNKKNNSPENVEFKNSKKHNSDHIKGDNNPLRRFPEKNPMLRPGIMSNENNPRWNNNISIDDVLNLYKLGLNKTQIAKKLKVTIPLVNKRLELAKLNNHKVKKIEVYGYEDVYDGEVENYHNFILGAGIVVHNSGEITLSDSECCNLSELYLNNITSQEQLTDCATLLYKTQKAICALPFIHEETNRIVHKNMRIGLGVTGICQSINKIPWLDTTYKLLREFDKNWSKEREWPESIKLTTIKPSGTLSLLAGSSPGVHPAYSKYYIRRVRMANDDKLVQICKDLGYHTEYVQNFDGSINYNTIIVEFPCFAGDNVLLAKEVSAIKQLELLKTMQTVWSDNAVSVTVYYKKEEINDIKKWLKENYKDNVKSVSFLLHNEHGFIQAPYEEITEEKYKEISSKIKPLSNIQSQGTLDIEECAGACPIK